MKLEGVFEEQTFSELVDVFGKLTTVDLIPDGRNVYVTDANKELYIQKISEHRLITNVSQQFKNFKEGLYQMIPIRLLKIFD